jgi:hypothetical protein
MTRLNVLRIGGVAICFAFVLTAAANVGLAQTDPHSGTWVLNLEKSKYAPGTAPKSQTTVFSADAKGIKVVTDAVTASGPSKTEYTATFDGKDHPVKGNADWDTTALKRIDARTIEFTRKKGGKVVQTATSAVAADGKTRSVTVTGVNAQGMKVNTAALYIKK